MLKLKLSIWNKRFRRSAEKAFERKGLLQNDSSWVVSMVFSFLKWFTLVFFGLVVLFPFFLMITTSLMSNEEVKDPFVNYVVPENGLHWENFVLAFEDGYWQALLANFIVTSSSIVLTLFVTIFMGYAFAYKNWRFKSACWWFLLALLMIPEMGLMVGQYKIIVELGWNTGNYLFVAMVLPFIGSIFSAYMFRTAFEGIPQRTKEAALVDGASELKYFWKVALPMVAPTTWTVVILTTFGAWNSYVWPQLLNSLATTDEQVDVLGTWLFTTGEEYDDTGAVIDVLDNIRLAAAVLVTLPLIVIYFVFRKRIMNSVAKQGKAIKG